MSQPLTQKVEKCLCGFPLGRDRKCHNDTCYLYLALQNPEPKVAPLQLIPRFNWIHIERPEIDDKTQGGLFVPSSVVEQKQKFANYGTIVAMGEDVNTDRFQEGMLVVFAASGGYTIKVHGKEYFCVLESDIIMTDIGPEPQKTHCSDWGYKLESCKCPNV